MKSGRFPLPRKVIWLFYFIKKLSDKKLKKTWLLPKGLKLLHLNFEVSETTEAAARALNERIRGPTLVITVPNIITSKKLRTGLLIQEFKLDRKKMNNLCNEDSMKEKHVFNEKYTYEKDIFCFLDKRILWKQRNKRKSICYAIKRVNCCTIIRRPLGLFHVFSMY